LRRYGPPFPSSENLRTWGKDAADRAEWADWLAALVADKGAVDMRPLAVCLDQHLALAEAFAAGPNATGSGGLWAEAAGREATRICENLRHSAPAGGDMSARDYAALFGAILGQGTVRDRDAGHPSILIWGTLEARVQGVDLTILGGMNDGVWPEAPAPDPWLNRVMRAKAGLLLPERRIGLSAHDYQQAIAGKEVWITRAKRSADAETVPSRWINRLTNLLSGLPDSNGPIALEAMKARGDLWAKKAAAISAPNKRIAPAPRPAPCPPVDARPDQLSVTQIKTLIRDPFAIYARKVLQLSPLDPLVPTADAPLRGIIIHEILETFIKKGHGAADRDAFLEIAHAAFHAHCPWPTVRAQWVARIERIADAFLSDEDDRQARAIKSNTEVWGETVVGRTGVKLTCKADRIDLTQDDHALIYDYKTGVVPSKKQQETFDKQLLLEAAMVERGAFARLGKKPVDEAAFIGVNPAMKTIPAPLTDHPPDKVWAELETLFERWQTQDRGYTARLALFMKSDQSPYDHLSRYGEWDTNEAPAPVILK
jgi:ATP-dependent helicase/nuclease subunit B